MKILMTSSFFPPFAYSGSDYAANDLSQALSKNGHEVNVLFSYDAYQYNVRRWGPPSNTTIPFSNVKVYSVSSPLGANSIYPTYILGYCRSIDQIYASILKQLQPEVIHHHNIFFLGNGILKNSGSNQIAFYTAHDYWPICQRYDMMYNGTTYCTKRNCLVCVLRSKRPPQIWRNTQEFKEIWTKLHAIIAPSRFMQTELQKILRNSRIVHIPNFIIRPTMEIPDSKYHDYFLYVGIMQEKKGVKNLLQVFRDYGNKIPGKLILAGNGYLEDYIRDYIERFKLQDRITHLGWVDRNQVWSLYKNALALVLPSVWPENHPLVALEAISMGTPVIGSNMGGIPEIVEKIDKDLIFSAGNLEELRNLLVNFNKNKYDENIIKSIYNAEFSPDSYISKYLELVSEFS